MDWSRPVMHEAGQFLSGSQKCLAAQNQAQANDVRGVVLIASRTRGILVQIAVAGADTHGAIDVIGNASGDVQALVRPVDARVIVFAERQASRNHEIAAQLMVDIDAGAGGEEAARPCNCGVLHGARGA